MVGSTLKHYRILRQIGRGGMGEVYEAEDTRLHRRVALKVLPASVAGDPESRERFEREARAVAALNHPNIVTIYSVEDADGVLFLTMELVEGQTLADLIPSAGMPIERLLATGAAVADALGAAQQRGITHRDLKPANVMVTAPGQVKVLDFGLAKLREAEAAGAGGETTLATTGLTGEGRIVGTVAYMSPEQAEGKPVDPRSDIFSLGVMLHQMATGEQPFRGDTPVSVISAILKDTPGSVAELKPALPTDLARIVKRCLAKEPDRRYQTAIDLRNDLEELKADLQSGQLAASGVRRAPAGPARSVRSRALRAAAAVLVVALVAAYAWHFVRGWRAAAPATASISLDDMRMSRLTTTGKATMAAISPDGKLVVHVVNDEGEQSLWIRQVATSSNVQVVPPAQVRYSGVTISPDANYVYYSNYAGANSVGALYQVPALGGTARKILNDVDSPVSFSPDGTRFVFVRGISSPPGAQIVIAGADGTGERVVASSQAPDLFTLQRPSWSPDGARVAIARQSLRSGGAAGLVTVDVASGAVSPLGDQSWVNLGGVAWLADGRGLVTTATEKGATNRQVWRIAYPGGGKTRITNDLTNYEGVSLSADSRALVTIQADVLSSLLVTTPGSGAPDRTLSSGSGRYDGLGGLAWTPDGRIVYVSGVSGNADVWIMDADGSKQRQLTVDPATDAQPVVCGGGRFVFFTSTRSGTPEIWRMGIDGADPVQVVHGEIAVLPVCAPDADSVVYTSISLDARFAIWRLPIAGGDAVRLREIHVRSEAISPDGRLVAGAYADRAAQRQSVAVVRLDTQDPPQVFPIFLRSQGTLAFAPDGKALTYADVKDGVGNAWSQPLAGGAPRQLTSYTSDRIFTFAWSPDGRRLALARGTTSTDVVLLAAK